MNADDLARILGKKGYALTSGTRPDPKLECALSHEPLAKDEAKTSNPGKYAVRIKSYRRRLLDEDNLAGKYFVDCLRYAGILPSDAPDRCSLQTCQIKVKTKEEELTEIEIDIPL
jgi:hypothetical protein